MFWKILKATENLDEPVLVADIGGEVTGIFLADRNAIQYAGASAFGIKTLVRRIAASLKMDSADVGALLNKYTAGALDKAPQEQLERVLAPALLDWWNGVKGVIKSTKKIIISGGGADFALFQDFLKNNFKKEYNLDADFQLLRAEAFRDVIYPAGSLAGGGDVILAALILFTDAAQA